MAYPPNILRHVRCRLLAAVLVANAFFSPARALAQTAQSAPPITPASPAPPTATASSAPAEQPPVARSRKLKPWALNFAASYVALSGDDFDGSKGVLVPGEGGALDAVLIPELGSGAGFLLGVSYGVYPESPGSFGIWSGLTYAATWLSPHSPHAPTDSNRAILHDLTLPIRFAYRASRFIAPYAELAVGYGFLPLTGFHAVAGPTQGEVTFDGNSTLLLSTSFCFGVGSLFPINETISIDAFAGYRAFIVTNIDGHGLDDGLNAGGWQFHLGPAFFL